MRVIADVLVAADTAEASRIKRANPSLRQHLVLTPRSRTRLRGCVVGTYTWTPDAQKLPARVRMELKTVLMPSLAEEHCEIPFLELVERSPTAW
jgi:hypothetical protein